MIVTKGLGFKSFIRWNFRHIVWLLLFSGSITVLYYYDLISIVIPWVPVSVIGTAVAFYVGFKTNQAYDRTWEARKIWGGIVNESRTWGMMVDGYISDLFRENKLNGNEIKKIKKRLIYRHIAWLYSHRSQLLIPTTWEHISQRRPMVRRVKKIQEKHGIALFDDHTVAMDLSLFLPSKEYDQLMSNANTATQIINKQSKDLSKLREEQFIDDFRHTQMEDVLRGLYALQGKNERIKKFPLPRQYANMSRYFICILALLLPFSLIPELMTLGSWGVPLSIIINTLVIWMYVTMEMVGDYSENPFEGMGNDIPMMSLCRTIEIDLREMLGETDLPPNIEAKNGILM